MQEQKENQLLVFLQKAGCVIDVQSGAVLYDKNMNKESTRRVLPKS